MKQDENFFVTSDLNISAVLVALNFPLTHLERQPGGRASFFFRSSPAVKKAIQDFWEQRLTLHPQKIFDSLKFLKNRLHSPDF